MLDEKFWGRYFTVYDTLNEVYSYQNLLNLVIAKLPNIKDCTILDLGSGTGNLTTKLVSEGGRVTALDNSRAGLNFHLMKDPKASVYLHDIVKPLPFEKDSFDFIVSVNTICFINKEDRGKVFRELHRVLKKDGKLIVVNLLVGFKSFKIFIDHLKYYAQKYGLLKSLGSLLNLFFPALRMFYYAARIQRHNKGMRFFSINEQRDYLMRAQFREISTNELVFAKQAILNEAIK